MLAVGYGTPQNFSFPPPTVPLPPPLSPQEVHAAKAHDVMALKTRGAAAEVGPGGSVVGWG